MKKADKRKALVSKMCDMLEMGNLNNCHGMFAWERLLTTAQYLDLKLTAGQLKEDVRIETERRFHDTRSDNTKDQTRQIPDPITLG